MDMVECVARALHAEVWARKDSGEISDDLNDCVYHSLRRAETIIEKRKLNEIEAYEEFTDELA